MTTENQANADASPLTLLLLSAGAGDDLPHGGTAEFGRSSGEGIKRSQGQREGNLAYCTHGAWRQGTQVFPNHIRWLRA